MEAKVTKLDVQGRDCVGCIRFKSDIMVTMIEKNGGEILFHDFFLSTEQAENLIDKLARHIELNKE